MQLKPSEYAVAIKQSLTMGDILRSYVPAEPRKNRIPCPIHNGADYNFSFNDNGYHCFVCGASGDVIGFVQQYFNMSFSEAVNKLNDDFNLNLPINSGNSHYEQAQRKQIKIQSAFRALNSAIKKQAAERLDNEYWVQFRVYKIFCEEVERHKPKSPETEPTEEFLHALKCRTAAEHKLDEIFEEIFNRGGEISERINNAG